MSRQDRDGTSRSGERGALLVDLYQLAMGQSYFAEGMHERPAVFSLYARHLPRGWGSFVAAGLDDVLAYLDELAFTGDDLAFLEQTGMFTTSFLGRLDGLRFTGSVRAMPEGTHFFPGEPVLEIEGPVLEAQLVETVVLSEIHFQSLIASKAARCVDVAEGRVLADFGLRRTHRAGAGMRAARSSYLAGFDSTSNVLAGKEYGIPIAGTMAHSYVQCFPDELTAFRAFTRSFPDGSILLVDTYDTVEGTRRAALVGAELRAAGHRLAGIRLDSGDLAGLSGVARKILDEAGCGDAIVFVSGGLDERDVAELLGAGAPIDGFGIGSKLGTSADAPYLDLAYKLAEFDGRPALKLSAAKATLPGAKQVWRVAGEHGAFEHDVLGLLAESGPEGGAPLLVPVMEAGARVFSESLPTSRARCLAERSRLPDACRGLDARPYEVRLTPALLGAYERAAADARRRHEL